MRALLVAIVVFAVFPAQVVEQRCNAFDTLGLRRSRGEGCECDRRGGHGRRP